MGAAPESQSAQAEAWSAAAPYGAPAHDLGKIGVDLQLSCRTAAPGTLETDRSNSHTASST
nr:TraI domain-containing protein [Pseudomonas aeruginosa]